MNDGSSRKSKGGRPRSVSNSELLSHLKSIDKERFTLTEAVENTPFSNKSGVNPRLQEFVELGLLEKYDLGGKTAPNQYSLKLTEEQVISAIDELDQLARPEDVAEKLGCDFEVALIWLRALESEGVLGSKPAAGTGRVWSVREP